MKLKYKWWYCFITPIKVISNRGCFSNDCDDNLPKNDGCKCNDFNKEQKQLKKDGFELVKTKIGCWDSGVKRLWANNKNQIIQENYTCGR